MRELVKKRETAVRRILGSLCVAAVFLAVVPVDGAEAGQESLFIEAEELARIMSAPDVRVIDAADEAAYARAHIPGAVNVFYTNLAKLDERRKSGSPLPAADAEKTFGAAGIDAKTRVVVYDAGDGPAASGVWFVLQHMGHDNVRVLNGGFRKWMKEGRPVTQDVPKVPKKKFAAKPRLDQVVTTEWVKKNRERKDVVILDARSFKEFIGEEVKGGASRGGHVPGAVHYEWARMSGSLETLKPLDEIRKDLESRGITRDKEIVTYCNTGIGRSTDVAMVLKMLGYEKVREYTGSWEDWSSDPRLPIAK